MAEVTCTDATTCCKTVIKLSNPEFSFPSLQHTRRKQAKTAAQGPKTVNPSAGYPGFIKSGYPPNVCGID